MTMAEISNGVPVLTSWLRKQTNNGTAEQVEIFIGLCDRSRLEHLDEEMTLVARELRRFIRADDELTRRALAEVLVASLDFVNVEEWPPRDPAPDTKSTGR